MIGWKAYYGNSPNLPTNVNDIELLDNTTFVISINSTITDGSGNVNNEQELYTKMSENVENAVDTLYPIFEYIFTQQETYDKLVSTFPSVEIGLKNSIARWKTGNLNYFCLVIPGLKRVIVSRLSTRSYYLFSILNDGNLKNLNVDSLLHNSILVQSGTRGMSQVQQIVFKEFNGPESVKTGNIYCARSSITSTGYNWLVFSLTSTSSSLNYYINLFGEYSPPDVDIPENPYEPGGDSGEGGGGGSFDDNSDPIPDSSLPTISSANTGFTRIYNPTLSQVQALARYLWTDESVIQTIWNHIKQYFENPMEAIIGFNLVPVPVPDGGSQHFALMYIDTGVSMIVAANQFVDVDCGTLEITPYYGSALDYSPYTKISCFLPFIGTVQLNVDEVMNTTLQVKYRVDICSGSCVAKILVNGNVLYQYSGHCAINIPISAADFSSYVTAAISVAKLAIGAAVGGGMGALMAGGDNPVQQTNQVVTTTQVTNTARNPNTGRQITTGTQTTVQTVERPNDQSSTQGSYAGLVPENITNTVGQIMSSKPHVEHSGSFSGNTGYLGVRRPYVIIQRPNMCMPSQYQAFNGFPSMITLSLGECKGFTKVQQVQLTGFYATNPEQAEILQLLKSGVIL